MTSTGYTLDRLAPITVEQLDWTREKFMEEWRGSGNDYYIWHRNYKEHDQVKSPYKDLNVIVCSLKVYPHIIGMPCIYLPFRYMKVPIVVWK